MSKRRKYSPEFKRGAVEQVRQPGVSCAQVARELGIGANLLSRWKREAEADSGSAFGGTGSPRDEEMAPRTGVEPVTYRLGGGRSILLSYRGMARIITSISGGSRPLTQQTLLPVQMAWMCSLLFNQGARQRQCSVDVVTLMLLILRKLLCCRQMAAD
jgi:transposase